MTTDATQDEEPIKLSGATTKLRLITTLDAALVDKLIALGINDNHALLQRGASHEGREALCAEAGIDHVHLLTALYILDLARVDGIAWNSAKLLNAAGVTTVPDLAFRSPEDLLPQLQQANQELSLLKRLPSARVVTTWIEHARSLPQVLTFGGNAEVY
ncbi:MAG: DUF4332 domain-containing protein [Candidatus Viridilinea halotolerans]|uniref:DUF4332 domain-containing protein n=1 Tax=Candidatus Viridilinea halotolerans TaxID=2491704 RepID=A0A426U5M4_9CHLR|nr:MAG: DUF4332 domain-containing protein [Candidatus Viridilinea halotolerans]